MVTTPCSCLRATTWAPGSSSSAVSADNAGKQLGGHLTEGLVFPTLDFFQLAEHHSIDIESRPRHASDSRTVSIGYWINALRHPADVRAVPTGRTRGGASSSTSPAGA